MRALLGGFPRFLPANVFPNKDGKNREYPNEKNHPVLKVKTKKIEMLNKKPGSPFSHVIHRIVCGIVSLKGPARWLIQTVPLPESA
jgi:hypothetical protein